MTPRLIPSRCEHGAPGRTCPTCHPRTGTGAVRTPEQLAAMREAIAAGREYVAGLKRED